MLKWILSYDEVCKKWLVGGGNGESAISLVKEQVAGFEKIVNNDEDWQKLLNIAAKGRVHDAWLAVEWPSGFDELILCTPLCKLVDWECSKCSVGSRQNNTSCAHDNSLFGLIGVLVSNADRKGLLEHLSNIKNMLADSSLRWDIDKMKLTA